MSRPDKRAAARPEPEDSEARFAGGREDIRKDYIVVSPPAEEEAEPAKPREKRR